jgi:hypothetical protein
MQNRMRARSFDSDEQTPQHNKIFNNPSEQRNIKAAEANA